MLLVLLGTSAALFAQSSGPDKRQNDASVQDARQTVGLSVAATERSWEARNHYTYEERGEDRRLDALGHVKSENVDVTRMILVNGARFEQLMEHNGQPPLLSTDKIYRCEEEAALTSRALLVAPITTVFWRSLWPSDEEPA